MLLNIGNDFMFINLRDNNCLFSKKRGKIKNTSVTPVVYSYIGVLFVTRHFSPEFFLILCFNAVSSTNKIQLFSLYW